MERRRRPAGELRNELKRLAETQSDDRSRSELLHEVQVYQEELVVQNEALLEAQIELEHTRDRFIELYDFAPNGYITLDPHGLILQINLTGAAWIGKNKQAIEGMPLAGFVSSEDRSAIVDFMRRCRGSTSTNNGASSTSGGSALTLEVTLWVEDTERIVQLVCRPRLRPGAQTLEFFTAMVDITEHRRLETERERALRARAALTGRLISIQDDERHRIARDLHDNIGQRFTGLRLKLEAAALACGEDAKGQISAAQTLAEQIDAALDFIATELRPAALDLNLATALQQFVNEWSATFEIHAEFHAAGSSHQRVHHDVETHVYRIAQEALNNVYKHARARTVTVVLERRHDDLVMIVEDDGRGFAIELDLLEGRRHFGLVGMRERAELIGGRVEIESAPGRGTTVFLQVPAAFLPGGQD
jgi:signal transduction histidine kinase